MIVKLWENTTNQFEVVHANNSGFMLCDYLVVFIGNNEIYLSNKEDYHNANSAMTSLVYDLGSASL